VGLIDPKPPATNGWYRDINQTRPPQRSAKSQHCYGTMVLMALVAFGIYRQFRLPTCAGHFNQLTIGI
jgi:hypothetical protein